MKLTGIFLKKLIDKDILMISTLRIYTSKCNEMPLNKQNEQFSNVGP